MSSLPHRRWTRSWSAPARSASCWPPSFDGMAPAAASSTGRPLPPTSPRRSSSTPARSSISISSRSSRSSSGAGSPVHGVSFFQGGRRLAQLHLDRIDSRYPFVLDIPQSTTEQLLGDHLRALGGEVEREVELVGFEREADGVTGTLRHADGQLEQVRARYLCGCDGSHSRVRELAGIAFAGSSYEEEWILADVRIEAPPFARDEATIYRRAAPLPRRLPAPGRALAPDRGAQGRRARASRRTRRRSRSSRRCCSITRESPSGCSTRHGSRRSASATGTRPTSATATSSSAATQLISTARSAARA